MNTDGEKSTKAKLESPKNFYCKVVYNFVPTNI